MIVQRIRATISQGTVIPKPEAKSNFVVKAWGRRRGECALVYFIPNNRNPDKPHEKGITKTELNCAYEQLQRSGELTHAWFTKNLPECAKEGSCNHTTIGGIFELLGVAKYSSRGVYARQQ
jgi:hypothetical protein